MGWALAVLLAFAGVVGAALHYRNACRAEAAGRLADRAATKQASELAEQRARDAIAHQESQWRMRAQIEDTKHEAELADARAAADRYIADHRVQPARNSSAAADPLPTPKVTVPAVAKQCPPLVSWYPKRTCKPAPT